MDKAPLLVPGGGVLVMFSLHSHVRVAASQMSDPVVNATAWQSGRRQWHTTEHTLDVLHAVAAAACQPQHVVLQCDACAGVCAHAHASKTYAQSSTNTSSAAISMVILTFVGVGAAPVVP